VFYACRLFVEERAVTAHPQAGRKECHEVMTIGREDGKPAKGKE
jgi:hypothetical protein